MQGCQCMLPLLLSDRGAIFLAQSPSQLSTARDFGPAAQYATSKSTTRL